MFLSGPVVQTVLSAYGLHGGFLMMAALCSHEIVFAMLLRPSQLEVMQKNQKRKRKSEKIMEKEDTVLYKSNLDKVLSVVKVFKNRSFFCLMVVTLISNFSMTVMLLHLPNYAIQKGASESDGAFLMTLIGIGGTTSRLLTGLAVGKDNGIDVLHLEFGLTAINGVLTFMFPFFSSTSIGRRVYCVLFGLYSGGLVTLYTPIAVEMLGLS